MVGRPGLAEEVFVEVREASSPLCEVEGVRLDELWPGVAEALVHPNGVGGLAGLGEVVADPLGEGLASAVEVSGEALVSERGPSTQPSSKNQTVRERSAGLGRCGAHQLHQRSEECAVAQVHSPARNLEVRCGVASGGEHFQVGHRMGCAQQLAASLAKLEHAEGPRGARPKHGAGVGPPGGQLPTNAVAAAESVHEHSGEGGGEVGTQGGVVRGQAGTGVVERSRGVVWWERGTGGQSRKHEVVEEVGADARGTVEVAVLERGHVDAREAVGRESLEQASLDAVAPSCGFRGQVAGAGSPGVCGGGEKVGPDGPRGLGVCHGALLRGKRRRNRWVMAGIGGGVPCTIRGL